MKKEEKDFKESKEKQIEFYKDSIELLKPMAEYERLLMEIDKCRLERLIYVKKLAEVKSSIEQKKEEDGKIQSCRK